MERFSRTEKLLGSKNMKILSDSSVTIAGIGAVGGFAAEALVRSGIGKLTIIDFDIISTSNINRQILALESTVGHLKTEEAIKRLSDINPNCDILAQNKFIDAESIPQLLKNKPDIVIDAIDSVGPKVELLFYCYKNNIPVISSMGAARKTDPSLVKCGDLFKTTNCALARILRKALRRRGIYSGIQSVYSTELPYTLTDAKIDNKLEASNLLQKELGSLTTVTGIFGLYLADATIKNLLSKKNTF